MKLVLLLGILVVMLCSCSYVHPPKRPGDPPTEIAFLHKTERTYNGRISTERKAPDFDTIANLTGATVSIFTGSVIPAVVGTIPRAAEAFFRTPATVADNLTTTTR